jgi:hypothetical protein
LNGTLHVLQFGLEDSSGRYAHSTDLISCRRARMIARPSCRCAFASAEWYPCRQRALRARSRPSGVRGPVLKPPCTRQRPFGIAGAWQGAPSRFRRAPHRGASWARARWSRQPCSSGSSVIFDLGPRRRACGGPRPSALRWPSGAYEHLLQANPALARVKHERGSTTRPPHRASPATAGMPPAPLPVPASPPRHARASSPQPLPVLGPQPFERPCSTHRACDSAGSPSQVRGRSRRRAALPRIEERRSPAPAARRGCALVCV